MEIKIFLLLLMQFENLGLDTEQKLISLKFPPSLRLCHKQFEFKSLSHIFLPSLKDRMERDREIEIKRERDQVCTHSSLQHYLNSFLCKGRD